MIVLVLVLLLELEWTLIEHEHDYEEKKWRELPFLRSLLTYPALMGVPKRKTSKMRLRTRKASHRWRAPHLNKCSQCGSSVPSHTACPSCGYYNGRQVLTVEAS